MKKNPKKRKWLLPVILLAAQLAAGCEQDTADTVSGIEPGQSDLEYVKEKGTLVVGVTDFAPMDYRDGEKWVGFDAELAEAFAKSIGVTVELTEIDWDKKTELLADGSIDCIWNGMTMTDELQEEISCTSPYLSNAQVVVLQKDEMKQYSTVEACQHLLFAAEAGSAGETLLKEMKYRYRTCATQLEALQSVCEREADATVIDVIMAAYYTDAGQKFDELGFSVFLNDEKFCAGFRKDSDLTELADEFLSDAYENGTIAALADKYKIESAVLQTSASDKN